MKAVSEIIGAVSVVIVSIVLFAFVYNWGAPRIQQKQELALFERADSMFDANNPNSLQRKIENIANIEGETTFTSTVKGLWRLFPCSDRDSFGNLLPGCAATGIANNSIEFSFTTSTSNYPIGQGYVPIGTRGTSLSGWIIGGSAFNHRRAITISYSPSNFLEGWNYRKPITISNSGSALTDYQVNVTVDTASLISAGKMRTDCGDIRFTDSDRTTQLNYWLESGCNTASTKIWVKVPSIAAGSKTIYVYYGNPSAASASNATNTMLWYDDFDDKTVGQVPSGWTTSGGTWAVSTDTSVSGTNSLKQTRRTTFGPNPHIYVSSVSIDNVSIEAKIRLNGRSQMGVLARRTSSNTFYFWEIELDDQRITLMRFVSGSSTTLATFSYSVSANQWYKLRLDVVGNSLKGYLDDIIRASATDTRITAPGNVGVHDNIYLDTSPHYVDDFIVRKLASPEPTTSVGNEEIPEQPTLTDYQVLVTLDTAAAISAGKMRSDCADIRFTDSDEETVLSYWLESGCNTASTRIWVKVPSIPAGSKTIYVYYGNPSAASASNGDSTFLFFDDFAGTSLDTTKWIAYANSYSISNGILRINVGGIERTTAFPFNMQDGYIAETKVRFEETAAGYSGVIPEVASSSYTASSNANADATILYMKNAGTSTVYYWIGDGASTSFNVANGASTGWTSSNGVWYITGISIRGGEVKLWRDGTALVTQSGVTWSKNLRYVKLGSFHRDAAYNIQDTSYDWIRVRKFASPEPTVFVGDEESSVALPTSSSCIPTAGTIGKDRASIVCVRVDRFADVLNVTYKIWFRELVDASGNRYKINLVRPPGAPLLSDASSIRISFNGRRQEFQDTKTLIVAEVKIHLA
jgi:hypothetical protein